MSHIKKKEKGNSAAHAIYFQVQSMSPPKKSTEQRIVTHDSKSNYDPQPLRF